MKTRASWLVAAIVTTLSCSGPPPQDDRFVALAESYIEEFLERYPEYATSLGDHRYDGRLNDYTAAGVASGLEWNKRYLEERGIPVRPVQA